MLDAALIMPRKNRIADIIKVKGWSIYKLSKEMGMPHHNVKRIVRAEQIPDGTEYKTLLTLSQVLDVPIDELESME